MYTDRSDIDRYDRKLLRKKLKHGDITLIARRIGCDKSTVHRFFSWHTSNYKVLKAVLELIDERDALKRKLRKVIQY